MAELLRRKWFDLPSYKTELEGYCGYMVKVSVWKNGYRLQCDRAEFIEITWTKITIPYINQVTSRCLRCPLRNIPKERIIFTPSKSEPYKPLVNSCPSSGGTKPSRDLHRKAIEHEKLLGEE